MRKSVLFAVLFTLASTLSLSATVLQRPSAMAEVATFTSAPDFTSGAREFRAESVSLNLDRPGANANFLSGNGGLGNGGMFVNLDRPQFFSRIQGNASVPATPEPGSLALLASGLLSGMYFIRRRK